MKYNKKSMYTLFGALFQLSVLLPVAAAPWRSELYPASWVPPTNRSFAVDKLIQDFSYAGYHRGEEPIPSPAGPLFNVTAYGADPTGTADSTAAIQAAINAAGAVGGGVVLLPQGTFKLSRPAGSNAVLCISKNGVILRGSGPDKTFLVNTSTVMRSASVILVKAPNLSEPLAVYLTEDLPSPTRRLPVTDASLFVPGDRIELRWEFTEAWVAEHNQQQWWNQTNGYPSPAAYQREVTAVNTVEDWIEVDIPTRYTVKTRDNAAVYWRRNWLSESGIENLSIGNVQHPGSEWGETDYTNTTASAYDVHGSFLINIERAQDCWVSNVHSFQPGGNSFTCHMLSNGIRLYRAFRTTVRDCAMRRPEYGGAGGNGYMFCLQTSSDCLVENCTADFSRHGFVIASAGCSGNVFHRCTDRTSNHATGDSGSYLTSGGDGSDCHMHFSHSCLWDQCHAHNSFWESRHRGHTINHGLTSAHGVYWNTTGSGTTYPDKLIVSGQGDYGYVIGTSGDVNAVQTTVWGNTQPEDHIEGVGLGATLFPPSLYLDQLARRLGLSAGEGSGSLFFSILSSQGPP
jgi:hypothetical protein